jgi:hypothetical protein
VSGEVGFDELDHLLFDGVEGIPGWRRRGRLPAPGPAVLGIEAELSAQGLAVRHQDAGLAPDVAVEAVHPPALAACEGRRELLGARQPALVWDDLDPLLLDQGFEIAAKLALGRTHQPKRSQLGHHRLEEAGVRCISDDVVNGHAALRLLQREVPHAG